MNSYVVILRVPEYLADDWPNDTYTAVVKAGDPVHAVRSAQLEAASAYNEDLSAPAYEDDFAVIAIINVDMSKLECSVGWSPTFEVPFIQIVG